jgi:hypothetical protein
MTYLLLYLALGLSAAVGGMIAWRETPIVRRLLSIALLWIFWPMVVAAVIHEKWMLKNVSSRCAWCGEEVKDCYPVGNESWVKHAKACPRHPLREKIDQAQAQITQLETQLRIYQLAGDDE